MRRRFVVSDLAPDAFTGRGLPRPGSALPPPATPGAGVPKAGFAPPVYITCHKKIIYSRVTGLCNLPIASTSTVTESPGDKKTGGSRVNPTPSGVPEWIDD